MTLQSRLKSPLGVQLTDAVDALFSLLSSHRALNGKVHNVTVENVSNLAAMVAAPPPTLSTELNTSIEAAFGIFVDGVQSLTLKVHAKSQLCVQVQDVLGCLGSLWTFE